MDLKNMALNQAIEELESAINKICKASSGEESFGRTDIRGSNAHDLILYISKAADWIKASINEEL